MKKLFTLFTLCLLAIPLAQAAIWSKTFSSEDEFSSAGSTGQYQGFTWTMSAATYIGFVNDKGVQIGSSNNPQKKPWTLTLSDFTRLNVQSVVVNASVASSGGATIDVTVGGQSFGSQASVTKTTNNAFTFSGDQQGNIVISMKSTKNKAMYIRSVVVTYTEDVTPPDEPEATVGFSPTTGAQIEVGSKINLSLDGDADGIKYTTDGTEPSATNGFVGDVITASGEVGSTFTVKATAFNTRSGQYAFGTVATATYTLKESASATATFVFNTDAGLRELGITKPESSSGFNISGNTYTSGQVQLTATDGGTATRVYNSGGTTDLRVYKSEGSITLSVPNGYMISSIVFDGSGLSDFSASDGSYSDGAWSGDAQSVTFTASNTVRINTIIVVYRRLQPEASLYILGQVNGNEWNPTQGVAMDFDGTNYTANVYVTGVSNDALGGYGGTFAFSTVLAENNDDGGWAYVNSNRYEPVTSNANENLKDATAGTSKEISKKNQNKSFLIPAGLYTFTVSGDLSTFTLTAVKDLQPAFTPAGGNIELGSSATIATSENLNAFIASCNNVVNAQGNNIGITAPQVKLYINDSNVGSYTFDAVGDITLSGKAALVGGETEYASSKLVQATFSVYQTYAITCTANPTAGGTVTADKETARSGETVTLTINPKSGYTINSVTMNGTELQSVDGVYSFVMPSAAANVSVSFSKIPYSITKAETNCTISITDNLTTACAGDLVQFTVALPSSRYRISSVALTWDGNTTSTVLTANDEGVYSFTMQARNVTITAIAEKEPLGDGSFVLVTDASTLKAGDRIVITNDKSGATYPLSKTQNQNNRAATIDFVQANANGDNKLVPNDETQIITLEGSSEGWYFNVGNGYLYAASSSKNYLRTQATKDDNAKAHITINNNANASISFQGENTNNKLRYNSSDDIYSCYSSGLTIPFIFRQTLTGLHVEVTPEGGEVIGSQQITIDANLEGAMVQYQIGDGEWSEPVAAPLQTVISGNVGDQVTVNVGATLADDDEPLVDEASATYTFVRPAAPTITPATCSVVDVKQSVSITSSYSTTYPGTVIEYSTDDGTTWTTYTGEFDILLESFGSQATVQARVTVNGVTSDVVNATYTRNIQPVVFSPVSGTYYYGEQSVEMFSVTRGARIYYTMTDDGSEPDDPVMNAKGTILYSAPITDLQPGKTYRFKAVAYIGTTASTVTSAEYIIQNKYDSGNYLYSVAELNAMDATSDHWTMVNPVQVIYMSTYKQNGYQPEYCLVRDNTGYGMIYFGKENKSHNNYHVFGMGDWIAGGYDGPISNFKYTPEGESQPVVADTHPELGTSTHGKQINNWPSSAMSNSPVLPEYLDIPTILSSDPTDADKDYWGHYVHLRKTSVALTEKDNDAKWTGIITDENGEQINYYDKFYLQSAEDWTVENNLFTGHDNRTFDVYGFVAYYRGDYQISPFAFAWIDQPTCSHATDEYTSAQQVTLTSDEDPEATIWYKTSEMDDYAIYHRGSTITVNSTTTIEWYATKMSAFNDELESKRGSVTLTFVEIAKPEISPKSVVKTVGESVDVTIAFEQGKNVPDDAVIIYTTDGTDPKAGNQVYTLGTTMTFNTTTTVRAITRTGSEGNYVYSAEAEPQTYSFVKSNGVVYELVTNVNQLTENGVYMIVSKKYGEALSTTQNAANRGAAGVMFVEDSNKTKVYGNNDVALFQLSHLTHSDDQSGDNHFLFHTGNGANDAANGYICVGSESDNTLLTEPEEDDLGNDVVLVTIDSDGRAHLQMNYSGGSNRYIQYWNRDRYFTTYKTEDADRAVYIYYTAVTPLAVIEQSGKKGSSYTVADDLQVVWLTDAKDTNTGTRKVLAWARDLVDNISAVEIPQFNDTFVDYMVNAGQQSGEWQQNNWVMLDLTKVKLTEAMTALWQASAANGNHHVIIKGGTLTGVYADDENYTIHVDRDAPLHVEPSEPSENYQFNVYCAGNYGPTVQESKYTDKRFWFMTPKVMEVATHTWSVWTGDAFYAPERELRNGNWSNEAGLVGGFDADWTYNVAGGPGVNGIAKGEAYKFTGVTMLKGTGKTGAPRRIVAQDATVKSADRLVAPLDLAPTGNPDQVVTGVDRLTAGREVVSVTYCDVAGRMSSKPHEGVNIVVTRYSDGSTTTRKTVF